MSAQIVPQTTAVRILGRLRLVYTVIVLVAIVLFTIYTIIKIQSERETGTYITQWVLTITFIYLALNPYNWFFLENRIAGVMVTLGKISRVRGSGVGSFLVPFQDVWPIPLLDFVPPIVEITVRSARDPDQSAEIPGPIEFPLKFRVVMVFENPVRVILSVRDRDPMDELVNTIKAAVSSTINDMTPAEVIAKGANKLIQQAIKSFLTSHPLISKYGVKIVSVDVADIDIPKEVLEPQQIRALAKANAFSERELANARRDAQIAVGQGDAGYLAALRDRLNDDKLFVLLAREVIRGNAVRDGHLTTLLQMDNPDQLIATLTAMKSQGGQP